MKNEHVAFKKNSDADSGLLAGDRCRDAFFIFATICSKAAIALKLSIF
jgi:hypothetical protein